VIGRAPLAIAAVVVMGVVMVLTLTTLVPLNNRVVASAGADAVQVADRELAHRWDRLHWLRVALLAGSFGCVALA
jgi:hypothetical protein